jgi:protein gp37
VDGSAIEWTDATWNPFIGCVKVSAGCKHCYAERLVNGRLRGHFGTLDVKGDDRWTQPLRWQRPRRIFVTSLSDPFWDQVPTDLVDRMFAVMALAPRHTFQLLTKRADRMRAYLTDPQTEARIILAAIEFAANPGLKLSMAWPLANVHLGVSTENNDTLNQRAAILLDTPASVHWLSMEPLLGPTPDLRGWLGGDFWRSSAPEIRNRIDWVVAGGESGPGARAMDPAWVRELRDQCQAAGVPFLFKQWGEFAPVTIEPDAGMHGGEAFNDPRGGRSAACMADHRWSQTSGSVKVGKKRAGRELDGRTWDEYPRGSSR